MREISMNGTGENLRFSNVYGLCQHWNKKSTFSYITVPRPNHGFMFILCREIKIIAKNGIEEIFKFGDILYIPKGYRYSVTFYDDKNDCNLLLVNFDMTDLNQNDVIFYDRVTRLVSSASARYSDEFYKIISLYKGAFNSYFSLMSSFYSLLDKLAHHIEKKRLISNEYNVIAPAIMYLDSHINENTPVPELAKMCLVSEACFRRYFHEYTGISPSQYKIRAKIQKAKQMLATGSMAADDIAAELGFYDSAYFYKVFKKETGTTPSEYATELHRAP